MIKFGTDGWRAVIAEEFTFDNVRRVAWAIGQYWKEKKFQKGILVSYDRRFLSEDFAEALTSVLVRLDIPVWKTSTPFPTPAVSFGVKHLGVDLGVMITSSHNPPIYNGIKIKESTGAPANPIVTQAVEQLIAQSPADLNPIQDQVAMQKIKIAALEKPYMDLLRTSVDWGVIQKAKPEVIIDYMHGSGSNFLSRILHQKGISVQEVRQNRDPLFGGVAPEPLMKNLRPLNDALHAQTASDRLLFGFALDGDGDRIGVIDREAGFISAHFLFAILLHHLVEHKKKKGDVVKTFNISFMIDEMTKKYGLPLHVVPIGFKYIAEYLMKPNTLIGGEESGGIGVKSIVPERDGALNALLLLEAACANGMSLGAYVDQLFKEYGSRYYDRRDIQMPREKINQLIDGLKTRKSFQLDSVTFDHWEELDGVKWMGPEGWILFRPSGTEPLIRIYVELKNQAKVRPTLDAATTLAKESLPIQL